MVLDAKASGLNDTLYTPKFQLQAHNTIVNKMTFGSYMAKADLKNEFFFFLPILKLRASLHKAVLRPPYVRSKSRDFHIPDVYIDYRIFWNHLSQIVKSLLLASHDMCNFLCVAINPENSKGLTQSLFPWSPSQHS